MNDVLEDLAPIVAIVGPQAVKATYSDTELIQSGEYYPGWKVSVDSNYRGAHLHFSNKAPSLANAAAATLKQLKDALNLS
jgi:hypothetical protein